MARPHEVNYFVMLHAERPYLLARVRWPDVYQAMSAVRPEWQDDIGLFDLPYDPMSTPVTLKQAAAIAAEWGARPPADVPAATPKPVLIRRMPADWSNLSRAEREAWSIEFGRTGKRSGRRWGRRKAGSSPARDERLAGIEVGVIDLTDASRDTDATVLDLTAMNGAAVTTVEDA